MKHGGKLVKSGALSETMLLSTRAGHGPVSFSASQAFGSFTSQPSPTHDFTMSTVAVQAKSWWFWWQKGMKLAAMVVIWYIPIVSNAFICCSTCRYHTAVIWSSRWLPNRADDTISLVVGRGQYSQCTACVEIIYLPSVRSGSSKTSNRQCIEYAKHRWLDGKR